MCIHICIANDLSIYRSIYVNTAYIYCVYIYPCCDPNKWLQQIIQHMLIGNIVIIFSTEAQFLNNECTHACKYPTWGGPRMLKTDTLNVEQTRNTCCLNMFCKTHIYTERERDIIVINQEIYPLMCTCKIQTLDVYTYTVLDDTCIWCIFMNRSTIYK